MYTAFLGIRQANGAHAAKDRAMKFDGYETQQFYDEVFTADGRARPEAELLVNIIRSLVPGELLRRQQAAERLLLHMGITFNVYGDSAGTEKIFPFDLMPRIVSAAEWERIERGLKQRIHALNLSSTTFVTTRKL
jgi:uncharacterized circularly permuted ATP-grasp superfamily protein